MFPTPEQVLLALILSALAYGPIKLVDLYAEAVRQTREADRLEREDAFDDPESN